MPTVTPASTNVSANASETFIASTLFSAADPNSLPILSYQVEDVSTGPSQGFWVLNGTALANGQITTISAAQLSQLSFVAGANSAAPVTDMLEVAASELDGVRRFYDFHRHSFTVYAGAQCSTAGRHQRRHHYEQRLQRLVRDL